MHAGNDVGGAFGIGGDGSLGKGHAKGRNDGVGTVNGHGDGDRVVDIAGGDLEAPVLDREGAGVAGEGDHLVVLVERQLGKEPPGGAVGPEHCQLHRFVPFGVRPGIPKRHTAVYISEDAATAWCVTSLWTRARVRLCGASPSVLWTAPGGRLGDTIGNRMTVLTVLGQEATSSGSLLSTGASSGDSCRPSRWWNRRKGPWSPPDAFSDQLHHGRDEHTPDQRGVDDDCHPAADPKELDEADLRQTKGEERNRE